MAGNTLPRAGYKLCVRTTWGNFYIIATKLGVAMLVCPAISESAVDRRLERLGFAIGGPGKEFAHGAAADLKGYLSGRTQKMSVTVDLSFCTSFKKDIYTALIAVPFGKTITYGELAALGGHPGKARAVGRAMAENRLPIFIPCHRVVPASGGLGGWSGPKGWKKRLLALER